MSVASAVVGATVLALAAQGGGALPGLAGVAVVVVLALGWPTLLALPSPRGTMAVVAGSGLVAAAAVATDVSGSVGRVPVVLALTVLAASAHQLLRRDLRPRVVDSLGGTLLGAALAIGAAGWVALAGAPGGGALTVVAVGGSALACLVLLLPWGGRAVLALAVVVLAAALGGAVLPGASAASGAALGAAVAVVTVAADRLLAPLPPAGRLRARAALVAASLAGSGAAAYGVGRLLLG